jgi:two-component system chemotaxis response regulator CheY
MKSVLVVDDSEITRSFIRSAIEDIGDIEISEASSGFEALKVLPANSFDLVMVDINMPDINGLELINFIKKDNKYRDIQVIIVSTESSEEDRKRGMSLGAFAYLTKPVKTEELEAVVKKALGI